LLAGLLLGASGVAATSMTRTSHRPGWPAVPEPRAPRLAYSTIAAAVTAAAAGDTVVVCAGTYKETVAVARR